MGEIVARLREVHGSWTPHTRFEDPEETVFGTEVADPDLDLPVRNRIYVKATERRYSPRLQQHIGLGRWGHYGTPVLVFPTAGGDAEEIERTTWWRPAAT